MTKRLLIVVGARPNFIKLAPLLDALTVRECHPLVVHTGQHFDRSMSHSFFEVLGIREPDVHLGIMARSRIGQVGEIITKMESVFSESQPDVCCVIGDVTSTLAATVAAASCSIPVAHIEAGLRSEDRAMPEEVNRVMTDSIAEWLFVSEPAGVEHLTREGQPESRIHLVGDLLVDVLRGYEEKARNAEVWKRWNQSPGQYGVVTLHRPVNVDKKESLRECLEILASCSAECPLILPLHPRTKGALERFGMVDEITRIPNLILCEPLDYFDFLSLLCESKLIISDSGGVQLEATLLDVPCLTLRETTERPLTIEAGTNTLVGRNKALIGSCLKRIMNGTYKKASIPGYWDGHTAKRITQILLNLTPAT